MPDVVTLPAVPEAAVEAFGLALGMRLQQATNDEDAADWAVWHPCAACPMPDQPCACAGAPYADPDLYAEALTALGPAIGAAYLRWAADRLASGGALYAAGALRGMAGEVEAGAVKSSRPPQPAARPGGLVDATDWDSQEDTDAYG